jgi:CheY-like chemotaxis protein/two-component sensor histidine kinase
MDSERPNRAQEDFLAMLGHELRNPLSPIVTALYLIRERAPHGIDRELTIIERQVAHLSRLVDDLLDVSGIAQGKIDLKREAIDVAEVIASAVEMATPLFEQRRLHVRVKMPDRPLWVYGDPVRLAQALGNVLTNAAKFSPAGRGIEIRCKRCGEQAELRVLDEGIGIRAEMLPEIFELFTQEHQASDRAAGGLGLGLAIARSIVTLHGGTIEAASEGLGKGSTFIIRLPALEREQLSLDLEREASTPPANAPRILIVDDNVDAADTLSEALSDGGYATRIAHDGPDALRVAEDFRPTLAVLDIGLPVMDGYELAQRLREIPSLSNLRLIALTGYGRPEDRDRAHSVGFDEHFVKPISLAELQETLCRLLSA